MTTLVQTFDSFTLVELQRALDEACRWLAHQDGDVIDLNVRRALAKRIIRSAGRGERDPDKLKAYALAGIASGEVRD